MHDLSAWREKGRDRGFKTGLPVVLSDRLASVPTATSGRDVEGERANESLAVCDSWVGTRDDRYSEAEGLSNGYFEGECCS